MDFLDWTTVRVTDFPQWVAVKDLRLPPGTCPARSMQGVHDWARSHIRYQRDAVDEWSKPGDTLARGYGDCEDICIVERALLLNAGYRDRDIEMMVCRDLVTHEDHAVLWVKQHYCDNRSAAVLHVSQFKDYWPVYGHKGDGSYVYARRI